MNRILDLASAAALPCRCCSGQTNISASPAVRFFRPPVRLRTEARPAANKPQSAASVRPSSSVSSTNIKLLEDLSDDDLHSRIIKSGEFYLTRPEPLPDSGVAGFVDEIFRPEYLHLGKTYVSCPFVTAIKRRNPLAILSGLGPFEFKFLEISW